MNQQECQEAWYWIQGGLTVTKQNLKTDGGELGYFPRATESQEQMIGSQQF